MTSDEAQEIIRSLQALERNDSLVYGFLQSLRWQQVEESPTAYLCRMVRVMCVVNRDLTERLIQAQLREVPPRWLFVEGEAGGGDA